MPWIELGFEQPELAIWKSYPIPSVNGETFRFTFGNLQAYSSFKTFCLVRFTWIDGDEINYTPARRLYPKPEKLVIDFPIPAQIKAQGGVVWFPQVRKEVYRRWRGRSLEPAYTLQVEEFVDALANP